MLEMKKFTAITFSFLLSAAAFAEIYYGGTTDGSNKNDSIMNILNGGTYEAYYGGNVNIVNNGGPSGDVFGNITNELTGVTITGNFIGANWTNDSSGKPSGIGAVSGKVTNIFDNSKLLGRTYGGNLSSGPNSQWTLGHIGSIETIVKNGSYIKEIGISGGAAISRIDGSVTLRVEDSTVDEIYHNGDIYIGGDCNISITNSNVKNYFEAAPAASSTSWTKNGIGGNLNITIAGNSVVDGSAYPSLSGNSSINCAGTCEIGGDINFTIKDTAQVLGWISAGNQNYPDSTAKTANFNVESYSGASQLSIRGFDSVSISESNAVFANSFDVDRLTVDSNSTVTLASGTSFGSLSIAFSDASFSDGELFEFNLGDIFTDDTIVISALKDGSIFTVCDSDGKEWNASYSEAGNILIGSMVPEPSTYAAIFGLLALALAAYGRKK